MCFGPKFDIIEHSSMADKKGFLYIFLAKSLCFYLYRVIYIIHVYTDNNTNY